MSLLQNSNAISEGGYPISNSLRFQNASSQYLSRTPASASNRQVFTFSACIKRGVIGVGQVLFSSGVGSSGNINASVQFESNDTLLFYGSVFGISNDVIVQTTQVFRDPSAFYHIVVAVDTTQATASNRVKMYVNGTQVTAFSSTTYPTLNYNTAFNLNVRHALGTFTNNSSYFDGYMTEINFVDGQALTPAAFGETDVLTGQWVAKKYTGTYGTNGFYLPFSNGTSTTTLGYDSSGNSNNWTLNNFTRSAGVNDCWMFDVPSGNGSNYAVLNPLSSAQYATLTGANLNLTTSTTFTSGINASIGISNGKFYWEATIGATGVPGESMIGIRNQSANMTASATGYPGGDSNGYGYYGGNGQKYTNNAGASYGASYGNGDVVGIAFDADAGTITFYKNGTSQGTAFSSIPMANNTWFPAFGDGSQTNQCLMIANFGQRSFAYTPPTGFKALCTANLPAATIKKGNQYMDATTYSGTGASQNIVNAGGFSPDLVWTKARSQADQNNLMDTVRGVGNRLFSNLTNAETTGGLVSVNSNGFTIDATSSSMNNSGQTYVAWQWDAGSSTVTNTDGSISSQVRANPTAGVSVVTYTGNGVSSATVGHGLGVAPKMVIHKARSTTSNWNSNHVGIPNSFISLNTTDAAASGGGTNGAIGYQSTNTATTFQFTAGSSSVNNVNANGSTYVAYCFSEIAGFSKFGSYTGNGSTDGTFVYTGFQPKYVLVKRTDTATNWILLDSARSPYNVADDVLYPNTSNAEGSNDSNHAKDFLSNGFKLRTSQGDNNASGGTYIYMAFAENPFANSNAR